MPFLKETKSLSELYQAALSQAKVCGVAEHNLKLLMAEITNNNITSLFLDKDKQLSSEQLNTFNQYLERLLKHEPIQYIFGYTEFYGLKLNVNENVLIPRPETEGLVEWIYKHNKGTMDILDIGTGSGAIAIALKHLNPTFNLTATDISHEALCLAKTNAKQSGVQVTFCKADLFPTQPAQFDIIVSNPPYIASQDYYSLDNEVQLYEPKLALYAGKDGLTIYRRILAKAAKYLKPNGKLYFEIGDTQGKTIVKLANKYGYSDIELKQDLTGRDRYICISL